MPHYTAIVTLLAIAFYFFLATRVAAAHGKFGVQLPATTGNPDFERICRTHVNTLEWMPTFLVPLWLCALYLSDMAAAGLGLVWIPWTHSVFHWLQQNRREAVAWILHPINSMSRTLCWRCHRHCDEVVGRLKPA